MNLKEYQQRVIKITNEILELNHSMTRNAALRNAMDIAKIRDSYKVSADEKKLDLKPTKWKDKPLHVRANIIIQRAAERDRKVDGRSLPIARFTSGGKVSPK